MTLELEAIVLPAVAASPDALQREIDHVLPHLSDHDRITIGNPDGSTLDVDRNRTKVAQRHRRDPGYVGHQPVINLPSGQSTPPSSSRAPPDGSSSHAPEMRAM
ncbi:MAG: hypothetical protein R3A46_15525 [Thermomicrobiales bacterium]